MLAVGGCTEGMAAGGSSFIRLRLSFDYPPPAAVGCRLCWLLVDLNSCRVVADLESLIRDKFEFGRGSILSLFIQDCYLPHTESVLVVRDNDNVRVKVDCVSQVNGLSGRPAPDRVRKRKSVVEEEDDGGGAVKKKKKKRSKRREEEDEGQGATGASGRDGNKESPAKKPKKKKMKEKKVCPPTPPRPPPARDLQSPQHQRSEVKAGRPHSKAPPPPSSSSSSSSSSDDESTGTKPPPATAPPTPLRTSELVQSSDSSHKPTAAGPPHRSQTPLEQEEEEEEEEIQLVIHPPKQQPWRGGGRGGSRGGRGGSSWHRGGRFESRAKPPSYEPETPTTTPGVLQNGAHKRDYTLMPLLAAPPQVGQKIAFKLLELTENYTPEVSEYREGKILSFDPTTKQIELELLAASQGPSEPGKFDLVYQNPDGSERVEYAVSRGSQVTEQWETLLEPRLIV